MKVLRHRRRRTVQLTALAAAAVIAAAGCGSNSSSTSGGGGGSSSSAVAGPGTTAAPTPGSETLGVTPSTITIGQIATVGGPDPGLFANAKDSMEAYVAYINSKGGVDGRQLKLVFKDDALNCNTYTKDINQLATSTFAIVGTFSIVDSCGQKTLDTYSNFPDIQGYIFSPPLYQTKNALTPYPQPPGYPTTPAQWVKQKFPNDITKVGALYSATSKTSYNSITSSYTALGFKYVYSRGLGITETNFTSDILRMKSDGVKIVDLQSGSVQSDADFIQQAAQQGFHPDAILSAPAYDANLFKLLGKTDADLSNVYMPLLFPMYLGEDRGVNPELNTYLTWLDKVHPGDTANIYGVVAWASGVLFTQALEAAGKNPTRTGLINQVNKISNFTADGMTPPTNPAGKVGPTCIVVVGIKDKKFVRLDPTGKGYECNGTYHHITEAQASA